MHTIKEKEALLRTAGWTETADGCWVINLAGTESGHAQIYVGQGQPKLSAHRTAYEVWVGDIPSGEGVRHKCDNPPCINPAHLTVGTQADNMRDKVERNRQARGSKHGCAKLTEDIARQIVFARNAGIGTKELSETYGVSTTTIKQIISGKKWGFATEDIPRAVPTHRGVSDEVISQALNLRSNGWTQQDIADFLGIHQVTVSRIIRGSSKA